MRFFVIANVPLFITVLIVLLVSISSLKQHEQASLEIYRDSLLKEKKAALKHKTDIALKTIQQFYEQEDSEASQKAAMEMIKNQQFGENGYFWINDYQPRMVMHPHKPELDGQDLSDFKDPNGFYLFNEFVKTVKNSGAGFVPYMWPKPGFDKPQPKISYVADFKEWNWIVGTGIYIDDLDRLVAMQQEKNEENVNRLVYTILIVGIVLCLFFGLIMYFLVEKGFYRRVQTLIFGVKGIEREANFNQYIDIPGNDEITDAGNAFNSLLKNLDESLKAIGLVMSSIAAGDLSKRVTGNQTGDLLAMKKATNESIVMLSQAILEMMKVADQVYDGVKEVAQSSQSLAAGASNQASAVQQIGTLLSDVVNQAKVTFDSSSEARSLAENTLHEVETGTAEMGNLLNAMKKIDETTSEVSSIIKVIDEIAFQTNLLSLNAAVEAARAGKYGKGFAVVAEEVRSLANRSAEAARNTAELIENAVKQVKDGVENTDRTAAVLNDISESIKKLNGIASEVTKASSEQNNAIDEIKQGLEQVNQVVQQNSSISEQTASASEELSAQATMMKEIIGQFKLQSHASVDTRLDDLELDDEKKMLEEQLKAEKKYLENR